jgi:phospho-N-acetylmuramoyl-pentapeptide-transferase
MEHVQNLVFIFSYAAPTFLIALLFAPRYIRFLREHKIGKNIRETTLDNMPSEIFRALHLKKAGTPTMGGILIWVTVAAVTLASALAGFGAWLAGRNVDRFLVYDRGETLLPVFTLVTVGLLGAIDDWVNIKGASKGIRGKVKMAWLLLFSGAGAWWFHWKLGYDAIHVPHVGDFAIGWLYVPLFIFVIIASANAVNITDGLDGLASGLIIIAFAALGAICYAHHLLALATFCVMIIAATTAFLWFNIPPASFFMGDTGALALGATMGVIAMLTNSVLVLPLIGFVFVIDTLSSFLQLFWKRFFKRKLFPMAPLHHWLEKAGWPEQQVTMRLWIVGGVFAMAGLLIGLIGMGIHAVPVP